MQWNSVSDFLAMGGYALYVWSSFGLTALVMVVEIWLARRGRRQLLRNLSTQPDSDEF
jgi:heme exporter protein D